MEKYYKIIDSDEKGKFDAHRFLKYIRRSNDRWWNDDTRDSPWIFRGVGDTAWKLLPAAWRPKDDPNIVNHLTPLFKDIEKLQSLNINGWMNSEHAGDAHIWTSVEAEAIYQFSQLALKLGYPIDNPGVSPLNTGQLLRPLGPPYRLVPNTQNAPLAQHHGIPTRLLDWTNNPIFAAFFAASIRFRKDNSSDICIWACNSEVIEKPLSKRNFSGRLIIKHDQPGYKNQYLQAQQGSFLEIIGGEDFYSINNRWPALEDLLNSEYIHNPGEDFLFKIKLSSEHVPKLLSLLDREGINEAALMPSMDNVAQTVINRWRFTNQI
ncbi:MAG: FRG domain-containing protein [Candidatus Thiodiazotropha sp. (ex Codakia orbicularis)]|nr:FRG domain-containing protein [Candidatus Thiodiazotropha sp. (ex Codakia orbicularis)]